MSTDTTMKAVYIKEQGGIDNMIYGDVPIPKVEDDSILVKNRFSGVNYIDTYQRSGLYPVTLPFTLGREGAGDVVQVGKNVKDFKVGDRVVYLGDSAYAEYTNVPSAAAQKLKENMSYEAAAAVGIQALTAWTMVRDGYAVKKGDIILVHAAAGGVGLLLCQMLHHLGATVIGTVSNDQKAKLAKENGADYTIVYTRENVVDRVNEITNGLGCHAVLDGVGKATFEDSIACTRRLGTLISFGNASGAVPPISITCLTPKNLKLMRPQLFAYLVDPVEREKWWNEVFDLFHKKIIRLQIYKIYELKDAKQAHTDIESRKTTGKLLISM
ncbi:uncharacterized protein BX663DRAFT_531193 [Cokeromyces recurvatus]|uniref:uncharacterized protein n=1 Tax=Cokeromyces recurvatus TaxID=90255 RepID=UPI00221E8E5A|nr:uncharacterized protein BX663DRAFT_531193 [Cokeromyces recurvatus]KAI7902617.1 hypothetical protein BX663DRAFT_531193 [Cokeromyces recurvatus]